MPTLLQAGDLPGGYGLALVQAAIALVAVIVLAWVVLRWASRLGLGAQRPGGRLEVLERLPLDARRSIVLVRLGDRALLIGVGDGNAPRLLLETPLAELPELGQPARSSSFAEALRKLSAHARTRELEPRELEPQKLGDDRDTGRSIP